MRTIGGILYRKVFKSSKEKFTIFSKKKIKERKGYETDIWGDELEWWDRICNNITVIILSFISFFLFYPCL